MQSRAQGDTLWVLEIDGSSRAVGGGAGMVLQSPIGLSVAQAVKFAFVASDNEAECEAVMRSYAATGQGTICHKIGVSM